MTTYGEKTLTIFGGTGFIGGHAVRWLVQDGWRIKVACRVPERANGLKPLGSVGQIVPLACNFSDPASIRGAIAGSTHVVNCIGILNQKGRATFQRLHVDLPRHIAEGCAALGVDRFVHISALGLQGSSKYARSKQAGEQAVRAAFPSATILRPVRRVRAGGQIFQHVRGDGAIPARAAVDRRRAHQAAAGLCR